MQLTILTLLYQTLWEIPLVHKVRTCYTCMAANDGDIIWTYNGAHASEARFSEQR